MAAPTAIDVATRTTMAEKPSSPKKRKNVFKAKAEVAGKGASAAQPMTGLNKSASHKAALYTRKKG